MSLEAPTIKDVILRQLEQAALDLIVAVRIGDDGTAKLKAKKIGTLGDALK